MYSFRCSSSHLFLVLFLFSFETRRLRGDSSFLPEPLRIPPFEDIEFLDELHTQIQNIPSKSLKNDKKVLRYRNFKLHKTHNADGEGFFSKMSALKNGPSDQKSKPRTCAEACRIAFKSFDLNWLPRQPVMTSGLTTCYFGGGHLGSAILDFRTLIFKSKT